MTAALASRVFLIGLACALGMRAAPPLRADDETAQKVTLFTAVAEPGDEEKIPEKLKPYRKSLLRVAKRFRLAGTKHETLEPGKPMTVKLPEKLGDAKITWSGKTATVELTRDDKALGTFKVSRFPFYLVNEKLKVGGQQVVLILDKGHK